MYAPDAYKRALRSKEPDIKAGKFVIVAFDVLPTQVKLLKEGWATTLIGQRPMTMGVESVKQLDELGKGSKNGHGELPLYRKPSDCTAS